MKYNIPLSHSPSERGRKGALVSHAGFYEMHEFIEHDVRRRCAGDVMETVAKIAHERKNRARALVVFREPDRNDFRIVQCPLIERASTDRTMFRIFYRIKSREQPIATDGTQLARTVAFQ